MVKEEIVVKKYLIFVLTIIVIATFVTGCQQKEVIEGEEVDTEKDIAEYIDSLIGSNVPEFSIHDATGEKFEKIDLKGKNTVITFVSAHCDACHDLLVSLNKTSQRESDINIMVVSTDNINDLQTLNKELGVNINYYLDEDYAFADSIFLRYYPTTLFVNEDLIITDVIVGAKDFSKDVKPLKSYFGYDEDIPNIDIKKLQDEYKETHLGEKAKDFELEDNMEDIYKFSYDSDKKKLLVFMDTNCSACKEIESTLLKIREDFPELPIRRIAGQKKEIINEYLDEQNLDFRVLTDPNGSVMAKTYGVNFVPTILMINENDIIDDVYIGLTDGNKLYSKIETWYEK
jgi:peroxiredoxin